MSPRNPGDRRKSVRYGLKTDVYIVFRPAFDRLGTLKDVSLSGAAFEYSVFDRHHQFAETEEIDIFSSRQDHFMLRQVPCRVVYDVKLDQPSLINLETRRCGIKFGPLSPSQRQLLKQLLAGHAAQRLPDYPPANQGSLPATSPPTP